MSIKKFNEDWDGEETSVEVPGYGKWPNDGKENSESEPEIGREDGTLDGLVQVIHGLDKLLKDFDSSGVSAEDLQMVQDELDSLGNTWSTKSDRS